MKGRPVLVKREIAKGRIYAMADVDNPTGGHLAVAMTGPNGWQVAVAGAVVGSGLGQRQAVALMKRAAVEQVERPTTARRVKRPGIEHPPY